ncbi:hypothetical protein APUTEX25_005140, partial [Auxenochlorella protothecoides]
RVLVTMSLLDEVFQQAVQASTTDSLALETACKQLNLLAPGLSRVSAGAVDKFAQRVGKGVGTPASKTKGTGSRAAHFRAAALLAAECGAPAFSAGLADWVAAAHAAIRAAPWDEDVAPAWRLAATIAARVERSQDSTLGLARAAAPLLSRLAPLAARCLAENGGHPATLCALRALAAVQRALPQSLRQQAGDLRAALGAALTDAALPRPVWLAVARCWALLPASPGAAADWAAAMQTLLASAHDLLGVLYAGLEAEAAVKEASRPGVPLTKAAALCRGLAPMHAGALGLVREAFYGAARALASVGGVALAADFGPSLLAAVAADAYGAAGHAGPVTGGATATRAAPATVADAAGSRSLHQRVDLCAAALDALGSLLAGCGHALASDQRDRDPGLRALARDALLAGATEGGSGGAPMEQAHPDGSSEFGDGQGLEGPAAGAHALARQAQQVLGGPGDFAVTVAAREVREAEKRGPPEESGAAEEVAAKRPATAGTTGPAASAPQRAAEPAPRGLSAPKTLPLEPASDSDDGSLPDIDSGSSDEGA